MPPDPQKYVAHKMVFDWERAADLLRKRRPRAAYVSMVGKRERSTPVLIYKDGEIVHDSLYGWGYYDAFDTPTLLIDGDEIECFRLENTITTWALGDYWPESARRILKG